MVYAEHEALESTIRHVNATYLARNMVNIPPNDKFPKKLVEYIRSYDWKNTAIHVLGKSELEKE